MFPFSDVIMLVENKQCGEAEYMMLMLGIYVCLAHASAFIALLTPCEGNKLG